MRKGLKKVVAFLMVLVTCIGVTNVKSYADETESAENLNEEKKWDGITTVKKYVGKNYNVIFSLTGYWDGGYNATIKVENTSNTSIENWYLGFSLENSIANAWNAKIVSDKDGQYVVKNAGWNEDIAVGSSVEFGISVNEDFAGFPAVYSLLNKNIEIQEEEYSVEYILDSDWNYGFSARILVTNNTEKPIEDWTLEFDFGRTITNIWNGVIESYENNHYVIKNAGYNSYIAPGQTISFGFNGEKGSAEIIPSGYVVYSYGMGGNQNIELPNDNIDTEYIERAIYTNLILNNMSVDKIEMTDDYDNDGLNLQTEYEYDTDPFSADTDEDGLNDYDEIYVYKTNPIKGDSDDDGMSDGTEVSCGLNPLLTDTDKNGVEDGQEIVTQEVRLDSVMQYNLQEVGTLPSITITGKGDYSQQLYAVSIEHDARITGISSLVGTPFDIVHDEKLSFESSCVTFTISDEILENKSLKDLAIASYDEETDTLEILETTYNDENHTISAKPTHYSPIFVVDLPLYIFGMDLNNEESIIAEGKADLVFVIDTTGSMEDEIQKVKDIMPSLREKLEQKNVDIRLGLVEYRDIFLDGMESTKEYGWYTDVDSFMEELENLKVSGGGGDGPETVVDALYCARNMKYRVGAEKYIIVLTDAKYKNGTVVNPEVTLADEIEELCAEKIVVSVITASNHISQYKALVEQTDGVSADINQDFMTELEPLITKMGTAAEGYWVRLANGFIVKLDADPALGDESVDTDGDGIPDVIELKACVEISINFSSLGKKVKAWTFESNPALVDTDGDGICDVDDLYPKKFDTVVIEENEKIIKFNSGRVWNKIPYTSFDYLDNALVAVDWKVDNPIEDFWNTVYVDEMKNEAQNFSVEELVYIGLINNEGSKIYMHNCTSALRERVFQIITDRESRYYRHTGIWFWEKWNEVDKDTESGFFKGKVLSEADLNFSWEIYNVCDVYSVLTTLAQFGALIIAVVMVVQVTPVVMANIQGMVYYVKTFGIIQGMKMYTYLGINNLPDGVITWLQMDMADGDSSLDDVALALQKESVIKKLENYLLEKTHPVGGSKAKWFEQALGFTKQNLNKLAQQIVFDEKIAIQTQVTEYGVKYNQVINIIGANGKEIDVLFVWIKNYDGVVRLVTAIPTPK